MLPIAIMAIVFLVLVTTVAVVVMLGLHHVLTLLAQDDEHEVCAWDVD